MNQLLHFGILVVNLALAGYSLAFIAVGKSKKPSNLFFGSLLAGLLFDITATILMIAGSSNGPVTLHGVIGYSALLFMLYETYSTLRFRRRNRTNEGLGNKQVRLFTIAYFYWIAAYITGVVIVMMKRWANA